MNMFVCHTTTARAEAKYMSPLVEQYISTKTSAPVGGQLQDSVVGSSRLTRRGVELSKWHAMTLFAAAGVEPPVFAGRRTYTGHDLVSMLFSREAPINYRRAPTYYNEAFAPFIAYDASETMTVMERGVLKQGVLDKKGVGNALGGINHLVAREYGAQKALDVIFALQQMTIQYLMYAGFTVGTADLTLGRAELAATRAIVAKVLAEADLVTRKLTNGEIIPPIDMTVHEYYEKQMRNALRASDSESLRQVMKAMRLDTNGMLSMVLSGAKGTTANLLHISAVIGQITINGERIREQFSFRRALPYYPRFATDPAAHGFIASSYMSGMTSPEFTYNAMNGRFDLINKALSTSVTGSFMRKGVMANQSALTDNLRRVTKNGRIVQRLYGEDGMDARRLELVTIRTAVMSDAEIFGKFCAGTGVAEGPSDELTTLLVAAHRQLLADRDLYRSVFLRVEAANFRRPLSDEVWLAVNVRRLVETALLAGRDTPAPAGEKLAVKVARVAALCELFPYLLINEIQERRRAPVPPHLAAATTLQVMAVRMELAPATLARLSLAQVDGLVAEIRTRYGLSLIDYGTAVGILACHAVSEPLTQYMLDSHHRSVAGGTNKAGLVRVSEIYGARGVDAEQSPAMLLPVRDEYARPELVREIANSIEFMRFGDLVARHDLMFEAYGRLAYPPTRGDEAWIGSFERGSPLLRATPDLTSWCLRVVLDKTKLVLKSISLETIVRRLRAAQPLVHVVHTPESVPEVAIRVWLRASQFRRGAETADAAGALVEAVLATPVRGIPGILTATPEQITRTVVRADGALVRASTWAVATVGTNLAAVMRCKYIKANEAVSSSVGDTLKVFGILGARNKIVTETRGFMEDNTPSLRHLLIYADEMTRTGRYTSVERAGIAARETNNTLLRMAASAPIQVVTDAALNCTRCEVYGVAAPLMLGAIPRLGSLYNDVVVDEAYVAANVESVDTILDRM